MLNFGVNKGSIPVSVRWYGRDDKGGRVQTGKKSNQEITKIVKT
jgi:hypothetical protein